MNPLLYLGGGLALLYFATKKASASPASGPPIQGDMASHAIRTILGGRPDEMKTAAARVNDGSPTGKYLSALLDMTAAAVLENRLPSQIFEGNAAWTWALGVITGTLSGKDPEQAAVLRNIISAAGSLGLSKSASSLVQAQVTSR